MYYSSNDDGVLFNKDQTVLIQYPIGNTRTSYTIPESVTRIQNDAFVFSDYLVDVTIPEGVTSIGYDAFGDCTALPSVTIPESVTTIGNYAFACQSHYFLTNGNIIWVGERDDENGKRKKKGLLAKLFNSKKGKKNGNKTRSKKDC